MNLSKNQHPEMAMTTTQADCIIKYLNPSDSVFEWGSGGSTYNFCKYVNTYHSVEHDSSWYNLVKNKLNDRNIKNVNLDHISTHQIILDEYLDKESPRLLKLFTNVSIQDGIYYSITRGGNDWHCYVNYINSISQYNKKFNKVLVDGRARVFCAYKSLDYLTEDGILYIHDFSTRPRYRTVLEYYNIVDECIDEGAPGSLVVLRKK